MAQEGTPSFLGTRYSEQLKSVIDRDGNPLPLRPQVVSTYAFLAAHHDEVVSRRAIMDAVWRDVIVTEDSLGKCISEIRTALGDSRHETLVTVAKRGYRLIADEPEQPAAGSESVAAMAPPVPAATHGPGNHAHRALAPRLSRPVVAAVVAAALAVVLLVLPDLSADHDMTRSDLGETGVRQTALPDIDERDRIPAIALLIEENDARTRPALGAVAQSTRMALARYRTVLLQDNGRADYLVRLTADRSTSDPDQLMVEVSRHRDQVLLDAMRVGGSGAAVSTQMLGAQVAGRIAAPAGGIIDRDLYRSAGSKPVDALTRAECYVYGYGCTNCSGELDSITPRAEACLADILERDKSDPRAWALQSTIYTHQYQWGTNLPEPQRTDLEARADLPRRALAAANLAEQLSDGRESAVYWGMAQAHQASCDIAGMRVAIERGLAINPDDPSLLGAFGNWLAYAGLWDEGVALVERALQIQPDSYPRWWLFAPAKRHYVRGEYEQALALFDKSFNERNWLSHLQRAYTLPYLGRMKEAIAARQRLEQVAPGMTVEQALQVYRLYCFEDEYLARIKSALIRAGLPERGTSTDFDRISPPRAKIIRIKGVPIEYMDLGEAQPILFVHGALSDYRTWAYYQNPVSAWARYVSYSRRYYGSQAWVDGGAAYSTDGAAADLIDFIQARGLGPVIAVTWSSGARPVTLAAQQRPDLFRGVILYEPVIDSISKDDPRAPLADRDAFYGGFARVGERLAVNDTEGAARAALETVFERPAGDFDSEVTPIRKVVLDSGRIAPLDFGRPERIARPIGC